MVNMKRLILAFAAAICVTLLFGVVSARLAAQDQAGREGVVSGRFSPAMRFGDGPAPAMRELLDAVRAPQQNQVRIERRVIIRISPALPAQRLQAMPEAPRERSVPVYREVPYASDCVTIQAIGGSAPAGDDRLLLFLRDRDTVLSARLEASCPASAFYQGFYVERSEDGRVCVARDRLLSRAGASCMIEGLDQLAHGEE